MRALHTNMFEGSPQERVANMLTKLYSQQGNKMILQNLLPGNEKELESWLQAKYWEVGSKSSQFSCLNGGLDIVNSLRWRTSSPIK